MGALDEINDGAEMVEDVVEAVPESVDVGAAVVIGIGMMAVPDVENEVEVTELRDGEVAGALAVDRARLVTDASLESSDARVDAALATKLEAEVSKTDAREESVDAMLEISEVNDDSIAESTLDTADDTILDVGNDTLKLSVGVVRGTPVPVAPVKLVNGKGTMVTDDVSTVVDDAKVGAEELSEDAASDVVVADPASEVVVAVLSVEPVAVASVVSAVVNGTVMPEVNGKVRPLVDGSPPDPVGTTIGPVNVTPPVPVKVGSKPVEPVDVVVSVAALVAPVKPERTVDRPTVIPPKALLSEDSVGEEVAESPVEEGWMIVSGRPPVEAEPALPVLAVVAVESVPVGESLVSLATLLLLVIETSNGLLREADLEEIVPASFENVDGCTIGKSVGDPVPAVEPRKVTDGRSEEGPVGRTVSETIPPVDPPLPVDLSSEPVVVVESSDVVVAVVVPTAVGETDSVVTAAPVDPTSLLVVVVPAAVGDTDSVMTAAPVEGTMVEVVVSSELAAEDTVESVVVVSAECVGLTLSVAGPPVEAKDDVVVV